MTGREIILSVVVPLLVALVPSVLIYLSNRGKAAVELEKLRAEAAAAITEAASGLVDDLRNEVAAARARVRELEILDRQRQEEQQALQKQYIALQETLAMTMPRITELERTNEHLQAEITSLQKSLAEAEARITELEQDNTRLREENRQLRKEKGSGE